MSSPNTFTWPTELAQEQFPIAELDNLSPVGRIAVESLASHDLELVCGIRVADLVDIRTIANTDAVIDPCPKDRTDKRFGTDEAGHNWALKGRLGFLLRRISTKATRGYSWGGPERCDELPEHPITTAYRSIEPGTGVDLTVATVESIRAVTGDTREGLETYADNTNAVMSYLRAGARVEKVVSFDKDGNRIMRPTTQRGPHVVQDANGKFVTATSRMFMSFPETLQPIPDRYKKAS